MQLETVTGWSRNVFQKFWRWKSKPRGRPIISQEMRDLLRQLSKENSLWTLERIGDTLRLHGFENVLCEKTILKYMVRAKCSDPKSSQWLAFLHNHLDCSWAMDLLTVATWNFKIVYILVILDHGRRVVIHSKATLNPTMQWVLQQLREATPFGHQPRFFFRDNDRIFGQGVSEFFKSCGIEEVRTAYRSPWQNPYVERYHLTLRRELLDHVIALGPEHVEGLVKEFNDEYYHNNRPHQGLAKQTPIARKPFKSIPGKSKLISIPILNGLHHRYERVAA